MGQLEHPITLAVPDRLVLLPHTYGHGSHNYMSSPNFPRDLPETWERLWGRVARQTGAPVVIGEWGGRMQGKAEQWQRVMQRYLALNRTSYFFWALNGNSQRVGGIYPYDLDKGRETLDMLSMSPHHFTCAGEWLCGKLLYRWF